MTFPRELHLYTGARIFTADSRRWAEALLVEGDRIVYVGDMDTARRIAETATGDAEFHAEDLAGALVLPGFVDGHAHVVGTGEVMGQVDLWGASTLEEIQDRIRSWVDEHPDATRVRAQGWQHGAIPGGFPTREQLDEAVGDRPVYAQAYDFHSIWVNSSALAELGIARDTCDTPGGRIHRDAAGDATGYIDETAMHRYVWPFLDAAVTDAERSGQLAAALAGYAEAGVTAATDMGLDEPELLAIAAADAAGTLTTRIAAHWRVAPTGDPDADLAKVERAAALARRYRSPWFTVVGIKVFLDGTVDGCTAALGHPYADGTTAEPLWTLDALAPVVTAADIAGLQVAMHAIGDEAVRVGIAAIECAIAANGPRERRHRIEHLEVVEPAELERLASLGITASMQPVHADPAIQANWRAKLGDERVERGFPWTEVTDAGAALVLGTDSPTSPFAPLPNMFVAVTRRSAFDPQLPANGPRYALPLEEAIERATRVPAWACRAEDRYGRLAAGLAADFIVLDRDIFTLPPEELLDARVVRTVVGGHTVYAAGSLIAAG